MCNIKRTNKHILDFLQTSIKSNDKQFLTVEELSEKSGFSKFRIYEVLRKLKRQGKLEIAFRIEENLIGKKKRVPVYRYKEVNSKDVRNS